MANITIKRTGELLRTLFGVMIKNPEGIRAKDALKAVADRAGVTEYEAGMYQSGAVPGRRFEKIVRFATVDAVKAGWMRKEKGIWTITQDGKDAYSKFTEPEEFYREATRLYRQWKLTQVQEESEGEEEGEEQGSAREVARTFEEAEEQAWAEIWAYLDKIPPYDFQDMVAALLEAMGYHVSYIAPPGRDAGIDIIAWNDPLGTKPPRIKVQVKRRADKIDVQELRSFMAVLSEGDVGLFVTTVGFTKAALDEARAQSSRVITLIDRERFTELWIEYMDKLSEEARQKLPLRKIYFLAPE